MRLNLKFKQDAFEKLKNETSMQAKGRKRRELHPLEGQFSCKLEIVKFIIETKQAEVAAAVKRSARSAERRRLLEALDAKENAELSSASKDQLLERLAALDE